MNSIRIYVHIPFCQSKCIYCDFASFVCDKNIKERYFDKLLSDICSCEHRGRVVKSIYIGGGTPSSVDVKFIEQILRAIRDNFVVENNAEITIECNPSLNSFDKLKKYKELGINRISFGVQSLNDKTLRFLHRTHSSAVAKQAIKEAKNAGFENISADLIIGVDRPCKLLKNAKKLTRLGITHLSAYMLQIEDGTPLSKMIERGDKIVGKHLQSEENCIESYQKLAKLLEKLGFERYEISNFCKNGYESKHNLGYWNMDEYLGFGLAAHSYIDGKRIANPKNFDDYFAGKKQVEVLTKEEKIEEKIMLSLRCKLGFSIKEIEGLGYKITKNPHFLQYIDKKILIMNGDNITLNPDFYGVSNQIIVNLLPKT